MMRRTARSGPVSLLRVGDIRSLRALVESVSGNGRNSRPLCDLT